MRYKDKKYDVLLGYLTFINSQNFERRKNNFDKSLSSLEGLERDNCYLVNFDNNSTESVKEKLSSFGFDNCFHFNSNYYDLSVLHGSYYLSKKMNIKYFIYAYDDIQLFNSNFLKDCTEFMNKNTNIDCVRLCSYRKDDNYFNPKYTDKKVNPDAVNHWCSHKNNIPLTWDHSQVVGNNIFHINDWHYTSRCALFRVESFEKLIGGDLSLPVLNFFEGYAYKKHKHVDFKTGILEGGAFKTLAMHTKKNSERLNLGNDFLRNIKIRIKDIEKDIDKMLERQ